MQRVLTVLLAFAPALRAQVARQADPVFISRAVAAELPRLTAGLGHQRPTLGKYDSLPARAFDGSRALAQPFASMRVARLVPDSVRAPQQHGHMLLGAVLGLGVGAGAGYLIAVPRVRAIERHGDGPFQQVEYVLDPVIGGLIGSIVGIVVGSHVR